MRLLLSFVLLVFLSIPAFADEFVYSPEGCEFKMTFPGEPYATKRCHDKMPDKCTLMTTYTQVFDLDATVNAYVTCTKSDPKFRKDFTPDLMRTSLLARPNADLLEVYDIKYQDTKEALMGSLFGAGKSPNGNDQMVYVTQIWVGEHSILTFEGEMLGKQLDAADKLFADLLGSLHLKDWKPEDNAAAKTDEKKEPAPAPAEAPAERDKKAQ